MMTVGLEIDTRAYFPAVTMMIAISTGNKNLSWICSFMAYPFSTISVDSWYASSFVFLFTFKGTTGVVLGNSAVDVALWRYLLCNCSFSFRPSFYCYNWFCYNRIIVWIFLLATFSIHCSSY